MTSMMAMATARDYAHEIGGMVRDVVRRHRRSGMKLGDAVTCTARELGLTTRRVRSYWNSEPVSVLVDEWFQVRGKMDACLRREASRLRAELTLLDARRAQIGGDQ